MRKIKPVEFKQLIAIPIYGKKGTWLTALTSKGQVWLFNGKTDTWKLIMKTDL